MRGYGVGHSSLPLHAAIAGIDSQIVLDEAHISEPLQQTVQAARELGADIRLLPMSATLVNTDNAIVLGADDLSHPVLKKRLTASKLAALKSGKNATLERQALELRKEGASSIAVWANTVDRAVEAAAMLSQQGETVLITGRDRQFDRDRTMQRWHDRLKSGSDESPEVFVVSTQCLEVGVDWDFEGLVTECASIDALRQRFGRLDRLGARGSTNAVIVKATSPKGTNRIPVYGDAAKNTWKWLESLAAEKVVDFGLGNSQLSNAPEETVMQSVDAPPLSSVHMDVWSMTGKVSPVSSAADLEGLELPALRADSLLGYLAALGVSRLSGCALAWKKYGPIWTAVLQTEMDIKDLAELLFDRCSRNPLDGCNHKLALEIDEWRLLPDEWKPAVGTWGSKGFAVSPLIAIRGGGRQFPVPTIDKINASMVVEEMVSALIGPWVRHEKFGFRFDPLEHKQHGEQWIDPSKAPSLVARAPTRLAIEALPLVPHLAPSTHTMCRGKKNEIVTWVVWRDWLSPTSIASRLALGSGDQSWECDRIHTGQAQYSFTPARPIAEPRPPAIPDVAPWLHGMNHTIRDVQVVWRDDTSWDALSAMPPRTPEVATIPLRVVREAGLEQVTRYRGADDCEVTKDFAPGDVLIVPSGTSGLSPTPTTDIAEAASIEARRPRLRILGDDISDLMETHNDHDLLNLLSKRFDLRDFEDPNITPYPGGLVVFERFSTSEEASQPVGLGAHCFEVAELAIAVAKSCGLSNELCSELEASAIWHDTGKIDPRFQSWLGAANEPLAKSGHTRSQMRAAWQASGYPRGQRHELLSAAFAAKAGKSNLVQHLIAMHHGRARPLVPTQPDESPLQCEIEWDGIKIQANSDDVPSDLENSFWELQAEHGYWGLALLSGILIAADHKASANPKRC